MGLDSHMLGRGGPEGTCKFITYILNKVKLTTEHRQKKIKERS